METLETNIVRMTRSNEELGHARWNKLLRCLDKLPGT